MHLSIINAYFKKEVGWKIELQMSFLQKLTEIPVLERIRNTHIKKSAVVTLSSNSQRRNSTKSVQGGLL